MRLLLLLKMLVLLLPLAVGAQSRGGSLPAAPIDSSSGPSVAADTAQIVKSYSAIGTGITSADIAALPRAAGPKKPSRNADLEGIVLTYQMDFLRGFAGAPVQLRQLRSGGFSFTFYFNQKFGQSKFSYAAGAGLSARNYFSNLRDWQTGAVWPDSPEVKNKHVFTTYELVPLELRYTTRVGASGKTFKISAGVNVGYTGSLSRKSELGSLMEKYKGRSDMLDLDPWRAAVIARMGYHRLGISMYYGLNDWFKTNPINGRPWSLGVSLLL
ncbi:MAG: hypothetical protein Q8J69_01235 [Sphingobacteriaceae bacterium]|nr:hypothetical protein [Sphingobacteriaceae bacterium]